MSHRISATRYHDICCGHRVHDHESKCSNLHGHNYRIYFTIVSSGGLDDLGRVLDFSAIKEKLCVWLEQNWDHKFLAWEEDPVMQQLHALSCEHLDLWQAGILSQSLVWVPFNPTAENMAMYLLNVVAPQQLEGTGCRLTRVTIEETRKCSASYEAD